MNIDNKKINDKMIDLEGGVGWEFRCWIKIRLIKLQLEK